MRFYLAGSMHRRDELRGYANELISNNIAVASSWLWATDAPRTQGERRDVAMRNINDLLSASLVVVFTDQDRRSRGGHHFEHGFACGLHALGVCDVVVVGNPENVFHDVDGVDHYDSWGDLFPALQAGSLCPAPNF